MFEKVDIFRMASVMATHAARRQAVIAENIANADTPNYKARDIPPFADSFRLAGMSPLRATRAAHVTRRLAADRLPAPVAAGDDTSPSGNSVSIETEMVKASQTRIQHDTALTVYSSALGILRTSLGR